MSNVFSKQLGIYKVKLLTLRVLVTEGCSGRFNLMPDNFGGVEVSVGLDNQWHEVAGTFAHECNELYFTLRGHRYVQYPDIGTDMGGFLFTFDHNVLSEVSNFTAAAVCLVYRDLLKAYKDRTKVLREDV